MLDFHKNIGKCFFQLELGELRDTLKQQFRHEQEENAGKEWYLCLSQNLFSLESYAKSTHANIFNKSSEVINSQIDFSHTKQTLRESQPKSKTSVNNLDFPGKNNHQHTWRKLLADH